MPSDTVIARALAGAFLAGALEPRAAADAGARILGRPWRWLFPLAQRTASQFAGRTPPRQILVAQFILHDRAFLRACERHELAIIDPLVGPPRMTPTGVASTWDLPVIKTTGELADWFALSIQDLSWFADLKSLGSKTNNVRLRHYHYRPLFKRFGKLRLIESPKPRLKALQRQILSDILERIPPHDAAHGFRRGHSIKSFAAPHVGHRVVLRLDLQDFFPSIHAARVQAVFRSIGYPERVADLLAGLCTNATPLEVWDQIETSAAANALRTTRWRYAQRHLPQGAPTSPALANLCAYRLDCRLAGLAKVVGAVYTRYADDLAFSGQRDFERVVDRFALHVAATAGEEGFSVNHHKTRIMRRGVRQRLAGVVVNDRLNVARADYDRLKAMLTNCLRHGVASQNHAGHEDFRAHLLGRISFVEMVNAPRGKKLRELFERIAW